MDELLQTYKRRIQKTRIITNLDRHINLTPHYHEKEFFEAAGGLTIFGKPEEGLYYEYKDRLYQNDEVAWRRGVEKADSETTRKTARWVQVLLSEYYQKPVKVKHIVAGINKATYESYWAVGFYFFK